MNIIDLRKKLQQSATERCVSNRRENSYTFGSPEWLEYMKDNNFEVPEKDCRETISENQEQTTEPDAINSEKSTRRIFLTPKLF